MAVYARKFVIEVIKFSGTLLSPVAEAGTESVSTLKMSHTYLILVSEYLMLSIDFLCQ